MDGNETRVRRIRDPIHDLIAFDPRDPLDTLAWRLINSREFQRLRRVRQLGFSEMVFPGATHTRFSHCLGAFHVARALLKLIEKKVTSFDKSKAFVAGIAALLHDIGHGPFSHVFENIQKDLGRGRKHELWGREIIEGDTEIHKLLDDQGFEASELGLLLSRKDPRDIYDSVVSSQFDADRLDYLMRDRYMSGTRTGAFDVSWLLDCLETGLIYIGQENDYVEVNGLYINHKGLAAAESYVLARFHLYTQVYLHKTTRSAERMLAALLCKLAELFEKGDGGSAGLHERHVLAQFFKNDKPDLVAYLDLDDVAIWSGISEMTAATDDIVRNLAVRLQDRKLYKCLDVGELTKGESSNSVLKFKRRLQERKPQLGTKVLTDEVSLTAYGVHEFEDPGAFQKVLIGRPDGRLDDIRERSPIVKSIEKQRIFRVYCSDNSTLYEMKELLKEVVK